MTAASSLLLFAALLGTSAAPMAQTTLTAGDIAVIGFSSDDDGDDTAAPTPEDDEFALLALVDIEVGTEIFITDKGVAADGTIQASGESTRGFTTQEAISAGDVFIFTRSRTTQTFPSAFGAPTSGGSSFGFGLSTSGDQIIVFQDNGDGTNTYIYALSTTPFDASFDAATGASTDTALPPGLTNGTTAIDFEDDANAVDNVYYDRTNGVGGSRASLLGLVSNDDNYVQENSGDGFTLSGTLGDGAFTFYPVAPVALPVTFEESIDYSLNDFGGTMSVIAADPADATNTVVQTLRPATAECFAGTTVGESSVAFEDPIPFTADETTMSVRVWSPEAGALVLFKVEQQGAPGVFVETYTYTTVAGAYETLVFDFSDPKPNGLALDVNATYNKASIFFDFQCDNVPATTLPAADRTYYWDDITFGSDTGDGETSVVINEVDADQTDTDAAEFVELYNTGTEAASLDGHALVFFNGSDDLSYLPAFDLDGVTIAAGDYYVICGDAANVPNCDMEVGAGTTNLIQNGADAVALLMGDAADFPNDTAIPASGVVDAIVYGTNDDDDTGLLAGLGQTVQYNDTTTESIQRSPDGDDTVITAAPTPGAVNTVITDPETFTALLRGENEVPEVETDAKGGATVVLDGTMITVTGTFDGLGSDFTGAHIHGGAADENKGVVVVLDATLNADNRGGNFEATNNMFTVRETFADSLRNGLAYINVHSTDNTGGEIRGQLGTSADDLPFFLSGDAEVPAVVTDATGSGTATLDGSTLTVTGSFSGLTSDYAASHVHSGPSDDTGPVVVALAPTVDGDSRGGMWESASNTFELRTTFADSVRAGLAYVNVHTATFGAGEIRGQIGTAAPVMVITLAEARTAGAGETVTVEGVVSRAAGAFTYIQDDTAGLTIRQTSGAFFDAVAAGTIAPGDSLQVTGTLSTFASLLQINGGDLDDFEVIGTGDAPDPQVVTLADLASNGEDYEGELVTVRAVTIDPDGIDTDAGPDGTFQAGTTYRVTDDSDATNAVSLRVPNENDSTVDGETIPAQANITAIVGQFDFDDPTVGYQLLAIDADDVANSVATEGDTEAELSLTVANPIRLGADVRFTLDVPGRATVTLYDALGRQVATLADGEIAAGEQTARLDAAALASGVYVLRLEAESGVIARTITVVR